MDRDEQGRRQRQGHAMEHIEAQQRCLADKRPPKSKNRASLPGVINSTPPTVRNRAPGPSYPITGVARAMLLPTVMAQIAS